MKNASTLVYTNANQAAWDASAHLYVQGWRLQVNRTLMCLMIVLRLL